LNLVLSHYAAFVTVRCQTHGAEMADNLIKVLPIAGFATTNAFELALNTATNSDGTTTETLSDKNYAGQTNGTFSTVSES
jgi:hypothetical protein